MVRCPETLWHLVVTLPSNPHSEATRLRGRADEGGRSDKKKKRRGKDRTRGRRKRTHVVYSLRGSMLVSDTRVNEARVGFLSHPKTMCRSPHNRVFAFGPSSSFTVPCLSVPSAFGLYRFSASDIVCPRPQHWLFLQPKVGRLPSRGPNAVSVVKKTQYTL